MMITLTAVTLLCSLALLVQMIWLAARGDNTALQLPDEERRRHYVWRMLYMNPADPRGWVPKSWGYGWTVNFRTMGQVWLFVALLAGSLLSALAMTVLACTLTP
jgi:uncharacterized membrane protein